MDSTQQIANIKYIENIVLNNIITNIDSRGLEVFCLQRQALMPCCHVATRRTYVYAYQHSATFVPFWGLEAINCIEHIFMQAHMARQCDF